MNHKWMAQTSFDDIVNIGSSVWYVSPDNNPLPKPKFTQIYVVVIRPQLAAKCSRNTQFAQLGKKLSCLEVPI